MKLKKLLCFTSMVSLLALQPYFALNVVAAQDENTTTKKGIEVYVTAKDQFNDEKQEDLFFRPIETEDAWSRNLVRIYPDRLRQSFLGVGGAMTESAAYNIGKMSAENQKLVYDAYFSEEGANYSLLRSSIGSADFHTRSYSYNDTESPDPDLTHFSIEKDFDYIIPAIKRVQSYRPDIKFFAAPWAPPAWMKKSGVRRGQTGSAGISFVDNSMDPKYYSSYANYFVKYIQAYENEGIPVFSISLQNEAQNNPKWEACTWSSDETATFIGDYLGPALEANGLNPELLIWDWDKGNDLMHREGFIKYNARVLNHAKARQYIDGIAFHWYAGDLWHEIAGKPMWSKDFYSLDEIQKYFPGIALYATEACQEKGPWLGSFEPADRYIYDILNDFEHGVRSWIDWNLVLDHTGGPTQGVINQCHAPIMLSPDLEPMFQPSYYILKRISREIQPGKTSIESWSNHSDIIKTAAIDHEGNVSILLGNVTDQTITSTVLDGEAAVEVKLLPHSLTTLRYNTLDKPMAETEEYAQEAEVIHPLRAWASSYEWNPFKNYRAEQAIDHANRTRWASDWNDRESITFELHQTGLVDAVHIHFENGQDAAFSIWTSEDGEHYEQVYFAERYTYARSPLVEIHFNPIKARFVRFQGEKRSNRYGYSIYDFKVNLRPTLNK